MAPFTLIIGSKNYSSWSLRAWLVLMQAEAEFEEIRIVLDTPTSHEQILQHSPSGKVPVLRHGSLTIWDSIAIGEYIAEQFPDRHLWPQASETRALARSVSAEMHAGFAPLRQHLSMDFRARGLPYERLPEVQADIDRILAIWRNCRQQFNQEGDFLFGHFTIADAMFAPVASRFITYGVAIDPVSQAYVDAIWALPAMQNWRSAAEAETETIPTSAP